MTATPEPTAPTPPPIRTFGRDAWPTPTQAQRAWAIDLAARTSSRDVGILDLSYHADDILDYDVMTGQLTIEDAITAGQTGATHAETNAGKQWADTVDQALHDYLTTHTTLHTDDVWDWLTARGIEFRGRAIGARYQAAARNGWMTRTDTYKPSHRSHGSPKPVWASLIYQEPAA